MQASDEALMAQVQAGDREAFGALHVSQWDACHTEEEVMTLLGELLRGRCGEQEEDEEGHGLLAEERVLSDWLGRVERYLESLQVLGRAA